MWVMLLTPPKKKLLRRFDFSIVRPHEPVKLFNAVSTYLTCVQTHYKMRWGS